MVGAWVVGIPVARERAIERLVFPVQ